MKRKLASEPNAKVTRSLRVQLTEAELKETSKRLAEKASELNQAEEDKKRASSEFTFQVKSARSEMTHLSQLITSGYELRNVECEIWFHRPTPGRKVTIRSDTGEAIEEKQMTESETQMNLPIWQSTELEAKVVSQTDDNQAEVKS